MIYFDQAATTLPKPDQVKTAMMKALDQTGNAGRGAHDPALYADRVLYRTRDKLCRLFHADSPSVIAFTTNVTQALNTVIEGLIGRGDHVISSICEHNSVLRPLYRKERQGSRLTLLDADAKGHISLQAYRDAIRPDTRAIVVHHASNVTGMVQNLQAIAQIAHQAGALLIVDAAQTAGALEIDMREMDIDILCFTGHKALMGPQGTGGICVREGISIPSYMIGGSGFHSFDREHPAVMPMALEAGTQNIHGIAGLEAGIDWIESVGIDRIRQRETELYQHALQGMRSIPGLHIYGDPDSNPHMPILTWNLGDQDAAMICDILWEDYGICARAGAHCAPLLHKHFGTERQGAVRFSFSYWNTKEEIDRAIRAIEEIMRELPV